MLNRRPNAWGQLAASEIRKRGEQNGSVLIIPVGSIEQHGPHLPVATDSILASEVAHLGAERVAEDLPIIVTPPIWSGFSPHHLDFGGTLSLSFENLHSIIEDIATTGLENGFDALLLLNGHGGNMPVVTGASSTIGIDHPDCDITALTYFQLAAPFIDEIRESEIGGMSHGGEFETSLMLYLDEEYVNKDIMDATPLNEPYELGGKDLHESGPLTVYRPFSEYSPSGAIGEPELASVDKGEQLFELLGDEFEKLLQDIHNQNCS